MLSSLKNGNNFKADKGQEAILYDSINNIYIDTKNVKKMESSNGKYHSYTFPILNPQSKRNIENLFFSLQADGTYKVFRVIYLFNENDIDNIQNGKFVDLKDKTQILEIRKGFDIPELFNKSSFPPTCAIVTVTYCADGNHDGGYYSNGDICPAHSEYPAEFCTGGDGGGGGSTQYWPTYDTGTGGTGGGGGGGEPTDPGDGTCIADADGNCIDDTTTPTLPPPGSVEDIYPDLFFETLGENNLQYWWTVDASDPFKIEVMNYLINERYTAEAESFALAACFAKKEGGEADFEARLINNPALHDFLKDRMSSSELALFNTLTTVQKGLYLQAAAEAYAYSEIFYQRPVRNRKGDAVKHTLWNALSTIYIGATLTKQLTDAHEEITFDSGYLNHYKEKQMDLYNNAKGIELGNQYGGTYAVFFQIVESALNNGDLRYLSHLEFTGTFWRATSSSVLTPTNQ